MPVCGFVLSSLDVLFSASYIGPNWAGLFSVIVVGFWQVSAKQAVIIYGTHQI
jgi:hypothetical protein